MQNKQKNILIWIVTWAALLVGVLYSPIGSPDLYTNQNFYVVNRGVTFQGGKIENAPNSSFGNGDDNHELNVPDYSSSELKTSNYAVGNSASAKTPSGGTSYGIQSQNFLNKNSSSGGMGDGGATFITSRSSRNNAGISSVTMTNGITTLSTNLSTTNTSTKYSTGASISGGTDPGGDPTGPPIPVPDGWGFLLLLAASYGIIKKKFFT